jgi:hypothetical protein
MISFRFWSKRAVIELLWVHGKPNWTSAPHSCAVLHRNSIGKSMQPHKEAIKRPRCGLSGLSKCRFGKASSAWTYARNPGEARKPPRAIV